MLKLIFFLIELIDDAIIDGILELMLLITPKKMRNRTLRIVLKTLISIWTAILLLTMAVGVFALISDDEYTHRCGQYLVFIPLCFAVVQIIVGLIVKITASSSKRKNN